MHLRSVTLVSVLALSALASPISNQAPAGDIEAMDVKQRDTSSTPTATTCVPAVVFAVRGSDPSQTTLGFNPRYSVLPSGMAATANAVISHNGGQSSTGLRPLNYPAITRSQENVANGNYQKSIDQGITTLQQNIIDYINSCPTGKIFLMGTSQGAQVAGGTLAGNPSHDPLRAHGRVTAAAIYADPTYIDGLSPIDQGSGADNGINGLAAGNGDKQRYLNSNFAGRLQTYCQAGDEYCDSGTGPNAGAIHGNSTTYFEQQATAFLESF